LRLTLVLPLANRLADDWSDSRQLERPISTCGVDASLRSQPSTSTPAPASFRIRLRNTRLSPSGSRRLFGRGCPRVRVRAVAQWLLFCSPPAARGAVGRTGAASLLAHSRSSVSIYRRLRRRVALTGHSKSFMSLDLPSYKKVRTRRFDRCMPTIISQKLEAITLEASGRAAIRLGSGPRTTSRLLRSTSAPKG
jgi:hypothetical protein